MSEFFKPWRRKVGVVTLLMACVFAAGWARSIRFEDDVDVVVFQEFWEMFGLEQSWQKYGFDAFGRFHFIKSSDGELTFGSVKKSLTDEERQLAESRLIGTASNRDHIWNGIVRCEICTTGSGRITGIGSSVIISYWSIVLLLTLISLWLLLVTSHAVETSQATVEWRPQRVTNSE